MKLYVHKTIHRYYDYDTLLSVKTGITWSLDGTHMQRYEPDMTIEGARARFSADLIEGAPIDRSIDLNPRGYI